MTLDELARSLPNGLHDAELHKCTIDYSARTVQLDLKLWIGCPPGPLELYRPATIELSEVHFWIVDPPHRISVGDDRWLVIDSGEVSALDKAPAIDFPEVPPTAFVSWIYVREWNSFMYVAAENAGYRWTGPEEDHA